MVLKEIVILTIQTCMDRVSLKNKCNSCYNSSTKTLLQTHLPIWQVVLLASCLQPCSIRLPNGSQTHVSCIGIATISPNMKIHNVLYLPNFKLNLLFIYKFTIDNKCCVNCILICLLQDLQNRKLMGIDKMRHGLYFLVPYSQASVESHIPKQLSSTCNSSIPCNSHFAKTTCNSTSDYQHYCNTAFNFDLILCYQRADGVSSFRLYLIPNLKHSSSNYSQNSICLFAKQHRLLRLHLHMI